MEKPIQQQDPTSYHSILRAAYQVRASPIKQSQRSAKTSARSKCTVSNDIILRHRPVQIQALGPDGGGGGRFLPGNTSKTNKSRIVRDHLKAKAIENELKTWHHHEPTVGGSGMTKHQKFLSNPSSFTGFYKNRVIDPQNQGGAVSGDYFSTPRRVSNLLMNMSYGELSGGKADDNPNGLPVANPLAENHNCDFAPRTLKGGGRQGDFRNEVGWRMKLRAGGSGVVDPLARHQGPEVHNNQQQQRRRKGRKTKEIVDSVGQLLHFFHGDDEEEEEGPLVLPTKPQHPTFTQEEQHDVEEERPKPKPRRQSWSKIGQESIMDEAKHSRPRAGTADGWRHKTSYHLPDEQLKRSSKEKNGGEVLLANKDVARRQFLMKGMDRGKNVKG
jgi:hypothetical protein